jgi:ribose transport system permease protein
VNGLIVVYGNLQPIIVTLATSSIIYGISRRIRPTPGGDVWDVFASTTTGRLFEYIPTAAVVLLAVILLLWAPYRNSRNGQAIYAIGGNERSAFLSGVKINRAKLSAYIVAGVSYAIAGIMLTAQMRTGDPTAANNFTNNTIAAAVLGGASLFGGKGSYFGSIAGSVILSLIVGMLIFARISSYYQNLIQGLILILALSIDLYPMLFKKIKNAALAKSMVGTEVKADG